MKNHVPSHSLETNNLEPGFQNTPLSKTHYFFYPLTLNSIFMCQLTSKLSIFVLISHLFWTRQEQCLPGPAPEHRPVAQPGALDCWPHRAQPGQRPHACKRQRKPCAPPSRTPETPRTGGPPSSPSPLPAYVRNALRGGAVLNSMPSQAVAARWAPPSPRQPYSSSGNRIPSSRT